MKIHTLKRIAAAGLAAVMTTGLLAGCGGKKAETNSNGEEIAELTWWQIGDAQKDQEMVLEKVNEYIGEKIGVKLKINTAGWGDYDQKMQVVINTGDDWDMCFTCSWANNYLQNANKGAFLEIDEYIKDTEMYKNIDERFWDAATASDDKSIKRFVTKGDGQPYAELVWGKDLGYDVVATPIMDSYVTNISARGALTAINAQTKYPEKAVELLNLINTDEYLRNLLNYGIEGVHWDKVDVPADKAAAAEGKPYVYDNKIKLNEENRKNYSVSYWVQGGLFNTYVLENEPIDKWATFKEFNSSSVEAPSFGFDFDLEPVSTEVAGFGNVMDEFGKSLYTGSVDPEEYLPKLQEKLEATGIDKVIDEMQKQIDEWKENQ